ncbi:MULTISPECIES: endolytic transglycosylase MltG [unclassified Pseudomonas]|uniref:endolytic transglycosylase MltG n=1 Tax=unclassified Pseudomonas TaxID=196821 RepID=UPI00244989F7|nr:MULTISPECIES: endolytic transglycosylase MltG [unclassified Pseudomonas]MDG9923954.1 endolytic transglycosylase MltG [Pseudomonas sp. GD04045]MDH0035059.1 endolytic transglycosylase MltG [Pseudomonas sp. GD04019]
MIRKLMLLLVSGLALLVLALALAGWRLHSALNQPLKLESERLIEVVPGDTPGGLLNRLEGEGVLEGAFWLRLYWRFNLPNQALHSGEYRLSPQQSVRDLLGLWRRGEVVQYSLTLVEGWSFRQVRAALTRQDALQQSLAGLDDKALMQQLGLPGVSPEGRFFPDTYRYVRGMSDLDLLKQASTRLDQVLDEEWSKRAQGLPYRKPYDALVMASMVEKETGVAEERGQIAGVFVRRLRSGMRLQTDPTVIFGLGELYNGNLTRAHLLQPTPYNTYVIDGMPPTPIALAGREAIHAALNPVPGKSLYFVARGDGSHVFSETLEQHNRAVREYQLKRRSDYRSSPAPR